MGTTFAWPMLRLTKQLLMILTFGCAAYIVYFLVTGYHSPVTIEDNNLPSTDTKLDAPELALDLKPYDSFAAVIQKRDVFSSFNTTVTTSSAEQTPTGQLPSHLKVVGLLVGHPSEAIIEDTNLKQTYFITERKPQAGISIKRMDKGQMILNYQGQNISIPIGKSTKITPVTNASIH